MVPLLLCLSGCPDPALGAADQEAAPADLGGADLAVADLAPGGDLAADLAGCLPVIRADLSQVVMAAPFAGRAGPARMAVIPRADPRWQAAQQAALAWAAADCRAFQAAAIAMGYQAQEVIDSADDRHHWVLTDASGLYNGVFVLRAPSERAGARKLVIDSPHLGYDFTDDRAIVAYRRLGAVAFLQNTAHRCNLDSVSGCSAVSSYACGDGGVRTSDVVHAVEHLYYAVYDGLEQARDDLHLEYHGAAASANAPGCSGTAHLSQASSIKLGAAEDGSFPGRLWQALSRRLGEGCVCYHQRETGCLLNGAASTAGRRTNAEAPGTPTDVCTTGSTALAGRFAHLEQYNIPVATVVDALAEALP